MKYFALLLDQMPSQVLPSQHIKSQLMTYYRIHSTFLYCWKENLHFCKEMSHVQTLLPKAESSPEAHFFPNPSSIVNFFYFWNELGFLFSSLMNKQRGNYKLATLNFDHCTGNKKRCQIQEAFQVALGQNRDIVSTTEQMPHVMFITVAWLYILK